METKQDVEKLVKEIVVEQLGVDPAMVTRDSNFADDLGADSLDSVELIMAFEEELGRCIAEEDAEKLKTVGDAIDYICSIFNIEK